MVNQIYNLKNIYDNMLDTKTILGTIITLFLFLYGGLASPQFPSKFKKLFNLFYFRILILSLVAYGGVYDFKISLLISICFFISISLFDDSFLKEGFNKLEKAKSNREFVVENFAVSPEPAETLIELGDIELNSSNEEVTLKDGFQKLEDILNEVQNNDNIQNMYELYSSSGNESKTLKEFRDAYFNNEEWINEWKIKSNKQLQMIKEKN